jgi:hypothetical protein
MKKDLEKIPEKFHVLFTSDWNKGNESTMNSVQRGLMSELYLEYNRWSIQQVINPKPKDDEYTQIISGFVKD